MNQAKKQMPKVAALYKDTNPLNKSLNHWSGRGRMPPWLVDAIAKGAKLEDFRIAGTEGLEPGALVK